MKIRASVKKIQSISNVKDKFIDFINNFTNKKNNVSFGLTKALLTSPKEMSVTPLSKTNLL